VRTGKGFSIVELLVVIAIIALLLALFLPALGRAGEQGKVVSWLYQELPEPFYLCLGFTLGGLCLSRKRDRIGQLDITGVALIIKETLKEVVDNRPHARETLRELLATPSGNINRIELLVSEYILEERLKELCKLLPLSKRRSKSRKLIKTEIAVRLFELWEVRKELI
jgi:prepilin-type N-terminal cleavage/methylation domain-containing protein